MNSEAGSRSLADLTLKAVADLIPCDLIAFDNFSDQQILPAQWHNNTEVLTPRITEICSQVFEKHPFDSPLVREQVYNGYSGVLKLSDFGHSSEFADTVFYNEVLRPINVHYQMGVVFTVGREIKIACSVNRTGRDFSERDRGLLTLATPHLVNTIRNVIANERIRENETRTSRLLEASKRGLIVLTDKRDVVLMSGPARGLVNKYFAGELFHDNFLPEKLQSLAGEQGTVNRSYKLPSQQFKDNVGIELRVSKTLNALNGETSLLLDEKRSLTPADLESLGLTPRQAEVLFWIIKGKTDDVIAELIGAGRRTVEKHLENIYRKLGVETRTAAAMAAVDRVAL